MWRSDNSAGLRVLLVTRISGLEQDLRSRQLPGIELVRTKIDEDTAQVIDQAEVVVADPALVAPHLHRAANLKWLQSTYAGVNSLFQDSSRRDYQLTRIKGVFGPLMAEYVLAHILARERHLLQLARQQQARQWKRTTYRQLSELTLGILGVGDIGSTVARAVVALGMTVWGLRTRSESIPGIKRVFAPAQLSEFLVGPDYLVNVLPSTPDTRGLLSGATLNRCRPSAIFINIGRGDIIDEASLVRAMDKSWISGAVLDVFPDEPLPEDSPLWSISGVTITPHVAALSLPGPIAEVFLANLVRYQAGEPLLHQVLWERGY
ncbi:MAG: D-2-hydroxyacid dehydrogenase [Fidelibacterota bacterium]|nr:MAG: D-2-hydroxyacid dehydrogenase [Candidatus Neomarinimicrobiota bacterium]